MRAICTLALLACAFAGRSAASEVLARYDFAAAVIQQWKLPNRLNEVSGLALTPDDRLFAVEDETAVIYEIDYDEGRLIKAFAFGDPVLRGDFEGIAWVDGMLYLTDSRGVLLIGAERADGRRVSPSRMDTGLGRQCEIEGLADDPETGVLLFACKALVRGATLAAPVIFEWSLAERRVIRSIELPLRDIRDAIRIDGLNPSGIAVDRQSGHLLIVAARQFALVELTRDGRFVDARRLPQSSRHRQAEGIEVTRDGKLLVADEGGTRKGRLAIYLPAPDG